VPIDTVVQRYGSLPLSELPKDKKPSPRQLAESYISYAAKVLVRDGFHGTIAILFSDHSSRVVVLEPRDNAEKYVLWRRLAEDVREFGATTIAVVGEIWIAQVDTSLPFKRAVDYSTKDEGLKVTVATKNGDLISLVRKFRKKGSEFEFDEIVEESGTPYFLEPIREVWKLPRFDDKAQPTDQDDKSEV
jgi:hypothetical protein